MPNETTTGVPSGAPADGGDDLKTPMELMRDKAAQDAAAVATPPAAEEAAAPAKPLTEELGDQPVMVKLGGVELPEEEAVRLARLGEYVAFAGQNPETLEALIKEMQNELTLLTGTPQVEPAKIEFQPIEVPEIDESEATNNELKQHEVIKTLAAQNAALNGALQTVMNMIQGAKSEQKTNIEDLRKLIEGNVADSQAAQVAATAETLVMKELGIRKTAAEIQEAMRAEKTTDPVRAVLNYFRSDVLGARNGARVNREAEMPESKVERTADLDSMTPAQLTAYVRQHPELLTPEFREKHGIPSST